MDNVLLKPFLMKKVREVSAKIGFDESKVTWQTYRNLGIGDAIILYPQKQKKRNDYGYCNIEQKIVFIEEHLILNSLENPDVFRAVFPEKYRLTNQVTLESVLIDEITHIQTGLDHDTQGYDKQFQLNWNRYFENGAVISKIAPYLCKI